MLADTARGKKGNGDGEGIVRLLDVITRRQSGLKYELVCHFNLEIVMVGGSVREWQ